MGAGEEVAGVHLRAGVGLLRGDDDKRRQVAVERPQAVADPRADARPGEGERPGVHAERGVVMVGVGGVHRADHRDIVDMLGHMGEERAHLGAAGAVRGKLPLRPLEVDPLVTGSILDLGMIGLDLLAVIARERWLGIEGVDVRHATGHEQKDHLLRLRERRREPRLERIAHRCAAIGPEEIGDDPVEQERSCHGGAEKMAPVHGMPRGMERRETGDGGGISRGRRDQSR